MFKPIYLWTLRLAKHRLAPIFLAIIGFIESIFFPIPADVMLAPMCLANRQKAWRYAAILSIASVIGGFVGYFLGAYFQDTMLSILDKVAGSDKVATIKSWYLEYGLIIVFVSGFTPIPYKVFTILSGIMGMNFWAFALMSALSRPLRFFLVAWAIKAGGERLERLVLQYIEYLGWLCTIILGILLYRHFS